MTLASDSSPNDASESSLPVVRDSTFARVVADRGVPIDLGRDVEIAFLQFGPAVLRLQDHGDQEAFQLDPQLTEVLRLRMPWASSADMAMQILRAGIEKDLVNAAGVLKIIKTMQKPSAPRSKRRKP